MLNDPKNNAPLLWAGWLLATGPIGRVLTGASEELDPEHQRADITKLIYIAKM